MLDEWNLLPWQNKDKTEQSRDEGLFVRLLMLDEMKNKNNQEPNNDTLDNVSFMSDPDFQRPSSSDKKKTQTLKR